DEQIEELLEGLAKKHKSAMDHVTEDVNKKHEQLLEILKKQGENITAMTEAGAGGMSSISLAAILKEKGADINQIISGDKRNIKIDLSPAEVKSLISRANVEDSTQAMRLNAVGEVATPRARMRDIFSKGKV